VAIEDAFDFRVDPISMELDEALVSIESLVDFVRKNGFR
jgi:acyl carrier protein